jgi:hypothetical protein
VWPLVEAEIRSLLATRTAIADMASYRLLSMIGNHAAFQLRQTLPSDLVRRHPLIELYEQDPCTFNRPWRRPDCEPCLTRPDLTPAFLARQLRHLALDPTLVVPADLGAWFPWLARWT